MFLSPMIQEAQAYLSMEALSASVQDGNLGPVPLKPLYVVLKKMTPQEVASYLPKLSAQQRQGLLDMDFWHKDDLDFANFEFWPQAYALCADENLRFDFAQGETFQLYLKGRFVISTFDTEELAYPEHDNWFLTEDNLLLFEFSEDCPCVEEAHQLVKDLYTRWGVERAYSFLFKMVADSFSDMQEEEYRFKKDRLRDYGFVDYYDALEVENAYPNLPVMAAAVGKRGRHHGSGQDLPTAQALDRTLLAPYKGHIDLFEKELMKITDGARLKYLELNFSRLVNATATLQGGARGETLACHRAGQRTRALLKLGMEWVAAEKLTEDSSLFEHFDFTELYKIGNTLIGGPQKALAKALKKEGGGAFLGDEWNNFLQETQAAVCRYRERDLCSLQDYHAWKARVDCLIALLPFIAQLAKAFDKMISEGKLHDNFYLNYEVGQIDFEAVLLSSFAKRRLEVPAAELKLGLTLKEFRRFVTGLVGADGKLMEAQALEKDMEDFLESYGLASVPGAVDYLRRLLVAHLEGNDYAGLADEDYRYVGGPVILNTA